MKLPLLQRPCRTREMVAAVMTERGDQMTRRVVGHIEKRALRKLRAALSEDAEILEYLRRCR